jgi:aminoglycoside 6'-N-acetyltransferase I
MRIVNLRENAPVVDQVAELLVEAMRGTGSAAWRTATEALEEVQESLRPDRISRIAIDENDRVLGWIGGIEEYSGNVWELHPLVVRPDCQGRGIGRALVADFEGNVVERGGHTIRLGTDDEDCRTTLGGIDVYPDVLTRLGSIRNLRRHPFEFYLKAGYHIVGVIPDANGFGKPDILMAKRISIPTGHGGENAQSRGNVAPDPPA